MTYVINGFGGLGVVTGGGVKIAEGGTGAQADPFGGIGGGGNNSESYLRKLTQARITFSNFTYEIGFFNREKYVLCKGSDGKFYKFKVPGSGIGAEVSDAGAQEWFDGVVASSKPVATSPGGGLKLPGTTFGPRLGPSGSSSSTGGANTALIVGGVALAAVAIMTMKKKKG